MAAILRASRDWLKAVRVIGSSEPSSVLLFLLNICAITSVHIRMLLRMITSLSCSIESTFSMSLLLRVSAYFAVILFRTVYVQSI